MTSLDLLILLGESESFKFFNFLLCSHIISFQAVLGLHSAAWHPSVRMPMQCPPLRVWAPREVPRRVSERVIPWPHPPPLITHTPSALQGSYFHVITKTSTCLCSYACPAILALGPSVHPSVSYRFRFPLFHLRKVYLPRGPQLTLVFWGKVGGQTLWLQSLEFRKKQGHDPKAVTAPEALCCCPATHTCLRLPSAGGRLRLSLRLSWTKITHTHTAFNSATKMQLTTKEWAR